MNRHEQAAADREALLLRNKLRWEAHMQLREWPDPEKAREGNRRYRREARDAVLDHYGRACACCGTTKDLSIDHVNGGGKAHRIVLFGRNSAPSTMMYRWLISQGFPPGFQVLCRPCNVSKGEGPACRKHHTATEAA
jgi:hypothetical protein